MIVGLDGPGDDFEPGNIDSFTGSELQQCNLFPVPGHVIPLLQLRHHSTDSWQPEFIRIFFDDGESVVCEVNVALDDNDQFEVTDCA